MAAAPAPRHLRRTPLRVLLASGGKDANGRPTRVMAEALVSQGAIVIELRGRPSRRALARAAIQEDVHAVCLGARPRPALLRELGAELRARGAADIRVVGVGETPTSSSTPRSLLRPGVDRLWSAGTPLETIVREMAALARPLGAGRGLVGDRVLARRMTLAERRASSRRGDDKAAAPAGRKRTGVSAPFPSTCFVVGVIGSPQAGKTTLIEGLVARFLREHANGRVAVLAQRASAPDSGGALCVREPSKHRVDSDRLFFRSLVTTGRSESSMAALMAAIGALRNSGEFPIVFVEAALAKGADPFSTPGGGGSIVDTVLVVTAPESGFGIDGLTGIFPAADLVVVNKADHPRAGAARTQAIAALSGQAYRPLLQVTTASRPDDKGVDRVYAALSELAEWEPAGGERACQLRVHG